MLCLLVSMESTINNNLTVGPPIELLFFEKNKFSSEKLYYCFEDGDPQLKKLSELWNQKICEAISTLPFLDKIF